MKPALLLLTFLVLTGCCAAESCECPNQAAADDIAIHFNRDTLSVPAVGFTRAETSRVLFIREPLDTASGARTDTVLLEGRPLPAVGAPDFVLRRDRPFSRSVIGLGGYRYLVLLPGEPGLPVAFRYELRDVAVSSRFVTTSDCCTCYENIRKEARVDNGPLLDLHTSPGNQPALVELRKP